MKSTGQVQPAASQSIGANHWFSHIGGHGPGHGIEVRVFRHGVESTPANEQHVVTILQPKSGRVACHIEECSQYGERKKDGVGR